MALSDAGPQVNPTDYTAQGVPVFWVRSDKTPFPGTHGYKDASLAPLPPPGDGGARLAFPNGAASGIITLDCDSEAALRRCVGLGLGGGVPEPSSTPGHYHIYYRYQQGIRRHIRIIEDTDVLGEGGYTCPCSVPRLDHLPDPPKWLLHCLGPKVPKGGRDVFLFKTACAARDEGYSPEVATAVVEAVNEARCEPMMPPHIPREKVRSAFSRPPATSQKGPPAPGETQNRVYADEFHDRHGCDFRFVRGEWLRWNGSWWEPDAAYEAEKAMTRIVREAKGPTANAVEGSLKVAGWHHAVSPEDVDRSPYLLACRGRTIDLRTGATRDPDRSDLITKGADMAFDPSAPREEWTRFVTWAALGDPEMEAWLQEFAGYCLTGDTEERLFTIHCGLGNNGKGVFWETLTQIMGAMAKVIHVGDLMENQMGTDAQNRTFADLAGVRLAVASESKEGARLNGALIKKATGGGETALARQLYAKSFQLRPEFKMVLQTNFRPRISNIDAAIKRRVRLVPWDNCIPEWLEDRRLKETLQTEREGILAWAVEGAVSYFARGTLPPCRAIEEATAEYFASEDWFKEFLDTYCDVDLTNATYSIRSKDLSKVFATWVDETGGDPKRKRSPRAIAGLLKARGFWSSTSNGTVWHGLRLSQAGERLLNPVQRRLDGV